MTFQISVAVTPRACCACGHRQPIRGLSITFPEGTPDNFVRTVNQRLQTFERELLNDNLVRKIEGSLQAMVNYNTRCGRLWFNPATQAWVYEE